MKNEVQKKSKDFIQIVEETLNEINKTQNPIN